MLVKVRVPVVLNLYALNNLIMTAILNFNVFNRKEEGRGKFCYFKFETIFRITSVSF